MSANQFAEPHSKEQSLQKRILRPYSQKQVAFHPVLGRIGGGATAGLFMSQMLYWADKGDDAEWIYKTIDEMKEETCLNRSEQERAIGQWTKLGVLEKVVRDVPPKRHFRINCDVLIELLNSANKNADTDKTDCSNRQNINTEITSENTNREDEPFVDWLMSQFSAVNINHEKMLRDVRERSALKRLIEQHGVEQVKQLVSCLPELLDKKFAPTIVSPRDLELKLPKLYAFWKKEQASSGGRQIISSTDTI